MNTAPPYPVEDLQSVNVHVESERRPEFPSVASNAAPFPLESVTRSISTEVSEMVDPDSAAMSGWESVIDPPSVCGAASILLRVREPEDTEKRLQLRLVAELLSEMRNVMFENVSVEPPIENTEESVPVKQPRDFSICTEVEDEEIVPVYVVDVKLVV